MESFAASTFGNLSAGDYALIGVTAMLSAMFSTLSGVGGGLILAIVMAPIVEVKALVPLLAIQGIVTNINRIIFYFRGIDVRVSLLAGVPSLFGAWVGTTIYKNLDPASVALLLGIFLLIAVPLRHYLARHRWLAGTRTLLFMGFVYGAIGSVTVGGGLIILPVLLGAGLMGPALLGTDAVIGLFNSVSRAGFYAFNGQLPFDMFIAGTLIGVCTVPGSWVAAQIIKRTDIRLHTLFMEILIVIGGFIFLYRAASMSGWFAG